MNFTDSIDRILDEFPLETLAIPTSSLLTPARIRMMNFHKLICKQIKERLDKQIMDCICKRRRNTIYGMFRGHDPTH
jgi:hypothetical protein